LGYLAEAGIVAGTSMAQCYSAGEGYRFKIIQGTEVYFVQEKKFEEALPNRTVALYKYETVLEFPL